MKKRPRIKQEDALETRLGGLASSLRKQADALSPGTKREKLLALAQQYEDGAYMSEWLRPKVQP